MKRLILLSLLMFSSCGLPEEPTQRRNSGPTDAAFTSYKTDFIDSYYRYTGNSINIDNVAITFVPTLENGWAGVCYTQGSLNWIHINKENWSYLSNSTKMSLIYHELGHCVLNKGHVPTVSQGGRKSIMNTPIPNDFYANEDSYLRELFLNQIF